jgi:hypothetical protein
MTGIEQLITDNQDALFVVLTLALASVFLLLKTNSSKISPTQNKKILPKYIVSYRPIRST